MFINYLCNTQHFFSPIYFIYTYSLHDIFLSNYFLTKALKYRTIKLIFKNYYFFFLLIYNSIKKHKKPQVILLETYKNKMAFEEFSKRFYFISDFWSYYFLNPFLDLIKPYE